MIRAMTQLSAQAQASWVPDDGNFGARLALIRQRMGWNVKEAAIATGQSVQSWREWEGKGRMPRDYPAVTRTIAERTGVDLHWLMTGRSGGVTLSSG